MTIDLRHARRLIVVAAVAGLVLRLAFATRLLDRQAADARRTRIPRPGATASRPGGASPTTPTSRRRHRCSSSAAPPAIPRSSPLSAPAPRRPSIGIAGTREDRAVVRRRAGRLAPRAHRAAARPAARGGRLAAAIAAVYPPLVWMRAYVLSETLYAPWPSGRPCCSMSPSSAPTGGLARAAVPQRSPRGFCAGVAVLVRPVMLFFLPLGGLVVVAPPPASLAVALALEIAVVAPWTAAQLPCLRALHPGGVRRRRHVLDRQPSAGPRRGRPGRESRHQARRAGAFRAAHPGLTPKSWSRSTIARRSPAIGAIPAGGSGSVARKVFYTVVPVGPVLYASFGGTLPRRQLSVPAASCRVGAARLRASGAAPHRRRTRCSCCRRRPIAGLRSSFFRRSVSGFR